MCALATRWEIITSGGSLTRMARVSCWKEKNTSQTALVLSHRSCHTLNAVILVSICLALQSFSEAEHGFCTDYTSLVPKGEYVCMITHLEAPDPGTTYLSTLVQGKDGTLTLTKTEPMDWSAYDGLWVQHSGLKTLDSLMCIRT